LQEQAEGAITEEDIPYALRNRPQLNQFQFAYWKAYQELSGSRQFTQSGVAEIQYVQKVAWLNENEIDDQDERRDYLMMIGILDGEYLADHYEKSKIRS
jgi:hypothetical protein